MANYNLMDIDTSLFDQNYVFYRRLAQNRDQRYRALYHTVKGRLSGVVSNSLERANREYESIKNMAKIELAKEKKALQTVFGISGLPDSEIYDEQMYNKLLNVLNRCLQIKEVYERNTFLIQNSIPRKNKKGKDLKGGQRNLMITFHTYFIQQLNEEINSGVLSGTNIEKLVNNGRSIKEAIIYLVDTNMLQIVNRALLRMFSEKVGVELKDNEEMKQYQDAYKELQQAINNFSNQKQGSVLAQQIYQIYGLDKLSQILAESIADSIKETGAPQLKSGVKNILRSSSSQLGGEATEAIGTAMANLIINKTAQGLKGKVTGGATWSGYTNMKPDFVITLNMNTQPVEQAIQNWQISSGESTRIQNIQQIQQLYNKIKNVKDGFIVYANAKNYGYSKSWSGFSAGKALRADYFEEAMNKVGWNSNFNQVVGAILQLTKGAIGEAILNKKDFERLLAKYVAYLLFDDVEQIGVENQSNTNALHVLYLNGVYVPISLVLFALAKAIETSNKQYADNLVRVTIKTTTIEFPRKEDQDAYMAGRSDGQLAAWNFQRQEALRKTTIQAHFLKNFQDLIRTYIKDFQV